jgi:glycosyltransferase involved in cell wall biosynthesis
MIRAYGIDAVLFYSMALYQLAGRSDVVTIYDLGDDHIDLLHQELGVFSSRLIVRLAESLLRRTLAKCDCVFSVSGYLSEKYHPRSVYLPNGVDPDAVKFGAGRRLRREGGGPVVGFVGSLEYFIDFRQIIDAAAWKRDITFVIAGGGRRYDWIRSEKERLKLDNLVLTGGLPHEEVLEHIDSFDICLNPFRHSPLTHGACPIKLFEYLAFRKPVISSRIQEVQRIGDGFLYWADSTSEMIARIDEILEHPDEAGRRAEEGFELVHGHYTWKKIARRFADVVHARIEEKHRC